jgi:intracellular multiplication protein IcmE
MNTNDLYYKKYLKYKSKYLKLRGSGQIGGVLKSCPNASSFFGALRQRLTSYRTLIKEYKCTYEQLENEFMNFDHYKFLEINERYPDNPLTIRELQERGFPLRFFTERSYPNSELIPYYSDNPEALEQLLSSDSTSYYSMIKLKNIGFTSVAILKAVFGAKMPIDKDGYTIEQYSKLKITTEDIQEIKKAGFTIEKLMGMGYKLDLLKYIGFTIPDIKKAGFTIEKLTDMGYTIDKIVSIGFTIADIKGAEYTFSKLMSMGYTIPQIVSMGFTITDIKEAEYTIRKLMSMGYTMLQIVSMGFTTTDFKNEGFPISDFVKFYKCSSFVNTGYEITDLILYFQPGTLLSVFPSKKETILLKTRENYDIISEKFNINPAAQLISDGATFGELIKAGYTLSQLKSPRVTIIDLKNAGFTVSQLKDAGFSASQLRDTWYNASKLREFGFNASELKTLEFTPIELYKAGFKIRELIKAGFSKEELEELEELRHDIFKKTSLQVNDFWNDAEVLKKRRYSIINLTNGGYTVPELKKAGFSVMEMKHDGIAANTLKIDGFDANRLKSDGFDADELKILGFSAKELYEAGFKIRELIKAGFKQQELQQLNNDIFSKTGLTVSDFFNKAKTLKDIVYNN